LSHKLCGVGVDAALKVSAIRKTLDNITVVMIAFDQFYTKLDNYAAKGSVYAGESDIIECMTLKPEHAPWLKDEKVTDRAAVKL
jgi:hypothetical protein